MSESTREHKAAASKKLKFAIFTCSTSRYQHLTKDESVKDESGDLIETMLSKAGHTVSFRKTISDNKIMIEESLRHVLASADVDAAIFTGGTGIAPSDITIETVLPFLEKSLPGFGEIFRLLAFNEIGSAAILSRAVAGVAKRKVFFCIPGSPNAVKLCVKELILPEASHILKHTRE
jgi:molybdenum cofactor biosynthesis protein B